MFELVPEEHREAVRTAAIEIGATALAPSPGGASGALTFRAETATGPHLVRVETLRGPLRNPIQYECMRIAADAGVAPPIRHLDEDAGVLVLPFLAVRPTADHPDPVTAAGELLRRLHDAEPFPAPGDHLDDIAALVAHLTTGGVVAAGVLDRHAEAFERIRAAYPWDPATFVSAHNDPNEGNVLFDGDRLWLVDWETARRNDPFVDLATVAAHTAPDPDARLRLLHAWAGREPTALDEARLALMAPVTMLWAGCMLLTITADPTAPPLTELAPVTLDELQGSIASGEVQLGTPAMARLFARFVLGLYLDTTGAPAFDAALRVAAG